MSLGGNFIDTADVYNDGKSEEIVGSWLAKQDRESLVIATKVRFPTGKGPNGVGLSRKHILAGVEASLKRLQTPYIDLLQVHWLVVFFYLERRKRERLSLLVTCCSPASVTVGTPALRWKKPCVPSA